MAHAGGRPTLYTPELAALICERVATSTCGLAKLCKMHDDLPDRDTINSWRYKHPEFSALYAKSKLIQADLLAEECLEISDDSSNDVIYDGDANSRFNSEFAARSRLRIDTRKWLASKLLPKQYGKAAEEVKIEASSAVQEFLKKLPEKL